MSVTRVWNGVRSHSVIRRSAAAVAALGLATLGLAGTALAQYQAVRSDIDRGGSTVSGYGIFGLGETLPSGSDPAGQSSDAFAISRWGVIGTDSFVAAGLSSGFFDSQPDNILGFTVSIPSGESTTTPGKLLVNPGLCLTGATFSINNFDTIGLGSIADDGVTAFRSDSGSGGTVQNGVARIDISDLGNTLDLGSTLFSSTSLTFLNLGAQSSTTQSVPSMDIDNATGLHVTLWTSFDRKIHSNVDGGVEDIEVSLPNPGTADFRGSVTYNGKAGLAAVFLYDSTGGTVTPGTANVVAVKIYQVTVATSPVGVTLTPVTTVFLPSGTPGTNYFSRTGFAGTQQIAINDNGDIAVPVVVGTNAQTAIRREILFASAGSGYSSWQVAADSGSTGTGNGFVTANPVLNNGLAISSPALDNAGNVYFSATSVIFGTGTVADPYNTSQAVYKSTNGSWTLSQLLRTGDNFQEKRLDPVTPSIVLEDQKYKVVFMNVQVASSNLSSTNAKFNSPGSIGPNAFQKGSGVRDGLMVQALVAPVNEDDTLGTAVQKYLYISPGNVTL